MFSIKKTVKAYPQSIWLLTLIEFLFISRKTIFNVSRDVGDYSATVDSSTSLAMVGIACSFLFIIKYQRFIKQIQKMMMGLLGVYVLSALSCLWSGNTFSILFKVTEVFANIYVVGIILILLYRSCDTKHIIYYIIIFCLIATYAEVLPEMSRKGFGFHHTNAYSYSAMIALLLCIGCIRFKLFKITELKWSLILAFAAWLGGTSTASYIACLAGLFLLYSSSKTGLSIKNTLIILVLCITMYTYFGDVVYSFIRAGHSEEEMQSGTGRSVIWEAAYMSFKDNPLLGSGFVVGEREMCMKNGYDFQVLSAHNSFISVIVNTGLVGFFLFLRFLFKWGKMIYMSSKQNVISTILFPIYAAIIINSAACPSIGSDWGIVSSCVCLIIGLSFLPLKGYNLRD